MDVDLRAADARRQVVARGAVDRVKTNAPPSVWLPPRAPVPVSAAPEPRVLRGQALQGRVDCLLLRGGQPYGTRTMPQGKDLRSQHARVRDPDEPVGPLPWRGLRDEEEPGAVGGAADVHGLLQPIDLLPVQREEREVPLRRGRQRLDDVLQRVAVRPVQQIEDKHRHLGVRQEELGDVPRRQVLADRGVVGGVAVVHQRLVETDEGTRAAGVPDPPPGRVAVVPDPDVRVQVLEPVMADHVVAVADHLEHRRVLPVREHERPLLAGGGYQARFNR